LVWAHKQLYKKAKRALHAIKLIRPKFTLGKLKTIITSNFFYTLYYNSEIWHLPNLNTLLKQQILSTSALAWKLCAPSYDRSTSYLELHHLNKRATRTQFWKYKLSLQRYNYNMYCICNPTCMYCLVNKRQTLVKSNNVKKTKNFHDNYTNFRTEINRIPFRSNLILTNCFLDAIFSKPQTFQITE
jgi:hypothetical protein